MGFEARALNIGRIKLTILLYIFAGIGLAVTLLMAYIGGAYWCWSQGQKNRLGPGRYDYPPFEPPAKPVDPVERAITEIKAEREETRGATSQHYTAGLDFALEKLRPLDPKGIK